MPVLNEDMTRKAKRKSKQPTRTDAADNVATLPLSAGQRLRAAREKAGLTEAEIAERLFLHEGFVKHLETDDFDKLPGPTFVKGYIKSYCRLVNLCPDPLIALYKEHRPDQEFGEYADAKSSDRADRKVPRMTVPQGEAMPDFKGAGQAKRKVSYVPHLIGILMVSAGIVWVASSGEMGQPKIALSRFLPGLVGETPEPSSAEVRTTAALTDGRAVSEKSPGSAESVSPAPGGRPGSATSIDAGEAVVASDEYALDAPRVTLLSDLPSGMAVSYQIQLPASLDDKAHRLKLTFLEKARVVVRDGTGAEAHSEEHAKGAEVRVALLGRSPYQVAVSKISAVNVSFDGESLSLPSP